MVDRFLIGVRGAILDLKWACGMKASGWILPIHDNDMLGLYSSELEERERKKRHRSQTEGVE